MNQFNVFIIISFLASFLMLGLAVYAAQFKKNQEAGIFVLLLVFLSVWTFAIGAGLLTQSEVVSFRWAILRMVGVTAVPVIWFLFSLHFADCSDWIKPWKLILLAIIPLVTIVLMATNDGHHLFLKDILFVRYGRYLIDETWLLGPWFWFHLIYSYSLIFIGDYFLVKEAFRLSTSYQKRAYALIIATIFPLIINLLFTFHLIPNLRVNYDPLGFVVAGLIFTWILLRWRLFDLQPIAHRLVIESMRDAIFVIDQHHRIVEINPAAEKILTQKKVMVIGESINSVFGSNDLNPTNKNTFEFQDNNHDQKIYNAQTSSIIKYGQNQGYLLILRDITDQKKLEKKLSQLAFTDSLTGLKNRQAFLMEANDMIERAKIEKKGLVIAFLDLDKFKSVNDQHGHAVGDFVLQKIAKIMEDEIRNTDIVSRFGGDEFLFLFPQTTESDAQKIIDRICDRIKTLSIIEDQDHVTLAASVGLVCYNEQSNLNLEDIINLADQKMYQDKHILN